MRMRFFYFSTLLIILSIGGCKIYDIGERGPAGGWVFYYTGDWSGDWRFLEAAPSDLGNGNWVPSGLSTPWDTGATRSAVGTGGENTSDIVSTYSPGGSGNINYAAYYCDTYNAGGYDDWYLPSKEEVNYMYLNLHMYFVGEFNDTFYWSSTENTADTTEAWIQRFDTGNAWYESKRTDATIRAIRKF